MDTPNVFSLCPGYLGDFQPFTIPDSPPGVGAFTPGLVRLCGRVSGVGSLQPRPVVLHKVSLTAEIHFLVPEFSLYCSLYTSSCVIPARTASVGVMAHPQVQLPLWWVLTSVFPESTGILHLNGPIIFH